MPIDAVRLRGLALPVQTQSYAERDVILHALSVGFEPAGADPRELDYVYEPRLRVSPSMALTWCFRSLSTLGLGVDFRQVVHAAQALELHAPLPVRATVQCHMRIAEVWDLGAARGAMLEIEREFREQGSGTLLATSRMSALCRGDGGFGGAAPPARPAPNEAGPPDRVLQWVTHPAQAALYRLQGDMNPLHIDPAAARAAGFERPILHGLATLGGCVRALLLASDGAPSPALRSVQARFSAPFHPGETLQVEIWHAADGLQRFQARALERNVLVLRDGQARLQAPVDAPPVPAGHPTLSEERS